MSNIDYEKLVFRKQFLLTSKKIDGLSGWKRYKVCYGKKTLNVHPDLETTIEKVGGKKAVLLGYMLDWKAPQLSSRDIVLRILTQSKSFMEFVESTYDIGGRFAVIYEDEQGCKIFHDAGGQREVYCHEGDYGLSCASQLTILARFMDAVDNPDEDVKELYFSSDFLDFNKQWIGEDTIYNDTKCLRPNHYLDMESGIIKRYWPVSPLERVKIEHAVELASSMFKGFLKAASLRKELILPVTAGWDSRILLAASREISDDVMYYIIKFKHMDDSHLDIKIPQRLLEKLGLGFNVIEAQEHVDKRFAETFCGNTAYCRENNLPGVYNVFFKLFPGRINLSGQMSEVIRSYRGDPFKHIDDFYSTCVARGSRSGYYSKNYVKKSSRKWIESTMKLAQQMNVDPFALFYWEEWLNWEASQRSETDIALEEYPPFNCRSLMALLLSVKPSYRNKYSCGLYRKLMEKMWPEVLSEPINPSFKKNLKGNLIALEMLYPLRNVLRKIKR